MSYPLVCMGGRPSYKEGSLFTNSHPRVFLIKLTKPPADSFYRPWQGGQLLHEQSFIFTSRHFINFFSSIALQHTHAIREYFHVWCHVFYSEWSKSLCRDAVGILYKPRWLGWDCLTYPGHSLWVGSYPSAEMQSVYSTVPANWVDKKIDTCKCGSRIRTKNRKLQIRKKCRVGIIF